MINELVSSFLLLISGISLISYGRKYEKLGSLIALYVLHGLIIDVILRATDISFGFLNFLASFVLFVLTISSTWFVNSIAFSIIFISMIWKWPNEVLYRFLVLSFLTLYVYFFYKNAPNEYSRIVGVVYMCSGLLLLLNVVNT